MHWTANAINTYMTEYNLEKQLRSQVADEVYNLIYFFDEHLGHLIFFSSLHAMISLWTIFHTSWTLSSPCRHSTASRLHCSLVWFEFLLPIAAGGACGVVHTIAFIEGSSKWLGLSLSGAQIVAVISMFLLERDKRPIDIVRNCEVLRFTAALGLSIFVANGLYSLAFPNGETPSEMGGWWCIVNPSRFEYCNNGASDVL